MRYKSQEAYRIFMHEVRAAILKKLYDLARKKPHAWLHIEEFMDEYNIDEDTLIFHLRYLEEKGFIKFQQFIGGGGIAKITALGIDAVENPEMFIEHAPFLQQIIIHGNVINSTIMQAESIKIRNGLNSIIKNIKDDEIIQLIERLILESYKNEPDPNTIKNVLAKIEKKAPEIAEAVLPYAIKLIERWLK